MLWITSKRPVLEPSIRVGLLGAGGIATAHAQALTSLAGVELVAVADVDPARARRLAERWKVGAFFSSLESMLADAKPDVVHVLLPPELHASFAIRCMAAGTHVFVEKPLCTSAAECRALETAAAQYRRIVGVNHNVTFEPSFLRLVEAIRERRLGAVQHVAVFYSVPFGDNTFRAPLYQREGPGAVILETGPHPLSLIVRLLGDVRSASTLVSAEMQGLPDTWQTSLACERGTAQCFIAVARPFMDMRVHVIGEDGCAMADLRLGYLAVVENTRRTPLFFKFGDTLALAQTIAATAGRGFLERLRRIPGGCATDDAAPLIRASIAHFYQALRAGTEPKVSLTEGLAVVRSCLQIIASGQPTQERVEVEPWRPAIESL
jgi:predicted dehydrogenase